ncbi:E3 ubiquitin-protein ligase RAD18 isoform X2 [Labrus bergylta]|uniref:E3 ubiquitin-protein ligase RAD18 isoform X2 n=1 Tax=Labrus bergylta TaxID=56723 RepID=UPI0010FB5E40|nr:E3 ubiquitin-protein ligase RAD18 isoform X2 [Labrus bergylta]
MAFQVEADFPPGLSSLNNVDTLLRCPICFDFLNITMMTKCSHNFCSLCIRKFLSYKLQCPLCNTAATEQDLRNNRLLDDLVVNFRAARCTFCTSVHIKTRGTEEKKVYHGDFRQQLSKANFDSPPISPKTPASAVKCKTPREKGQKCKSTVLSHFFQKRPKTSPSKETHRESSAAHCTQQGSRTARTSSVISTDLHSATAQPPVCVKEEPIDAEEGFMQTFMSIKQEDTCSYFINTGAEMAHSSSPFKDVKPVIKVECPVCSVSVPQQFINKHLDTCLSRGEKKESLRSSIGGTRRPMGKAVYNLLSLQELKRRLRECHLSMQGSRDQMIKRHREFVQIYNAQCDSLNPKSAEDIAKEVEANEKIKNQLQGKAKPVMVFSKKQSEEEIEEVHSNYRKQHSSDFSRLIAQVRGRLETSRQTCIKQEAVADGGDKHKPHSADQAEESEGCLVLKVEEREEDEESSAGVIDLSSSPTHSDVSISSSISDIFGPAPTRNLEDAETTSAQKRSSSSRREDSASPPILGKRRRKT